MADVHSKSQRSYNMSRIRSRNNTSTELRLASLFRVRGIKGWRRHFRVLGKHDFAFPEQRVAVFVDGCFWHKCPQCRLTPASHRDYWESKLDRNVARDRHVQQSLRSIGWTVIRIWEHSIRANPKAVLMRIQRALSSRKARSKSMRG